MGQHLWTTGRERLCAPPANGDGRPEPPSQWEMGCPALPSLPRQYGPGPDAPAPAKRRTRRGARDAWGRRRPPGSRTCTMELPPRRSSRSGLFPLRSLLLLPAPPGQGGAGTALPPARCGGEGGGGGALPASRDAATAAGTMAARAPRVRGRAALKGTGAGRSRDRGGHPNQAHRHTDSAGTRQNQLYSAFPPFMIDVQHSRGEGAATARPRDRGCPGTTAHRCWLEGSALLL